MGILLGWQSAGAKNFQSIRTEGAKPIGGENQEGVEWELDGIQEHQHWHFPQRRRNPPLILHHLYSSTKQCSWRENQTLIKMARMMIDEYKTPWHFWAEAVQTACHTINRLYLHKLLGKMAYDQLTGNPKWVTFEFLVSNLIFMTSIIDPNLLLRLMKVSYCLQLILL